MKFEGDFIQFYNVKRNTSTGCRYYDLCNGLNYIHDYVDVRWIDIRKANEFAPLHKNVYISAWYPEHQKIAALWARLFPLVNFTVGGPLYLTHEVKVDDTDPFPPNIFIFGGIVEELIGVAVDMKRWKLNFDLKRFSQKYYSYYVGHHCYWNGCSFCYNERHKNFDSRKNLMYDLEPLYSAPRGNVFLSTPAPSPRLLRDVIPRLDYSNKVYVSYLRANIAELNVLQSIDIQHPEKLAFVLGVEFPSDRMLKIMNKGTTLQEYINMILFLREKGIAVRCLYITHWPEIEESDLMDVKRYFDAISSSGASHLYGPLYIAEEVQRTYHINSNVELKTMKGHNPILLGYKKKLNDEYIRILNDNGALNRANRNAEMNVPVYDPELYKKFILPLEKENN